MAYDSLEEIILATASAVQPAERLTVSDWARQRRWMNNPGSYIGPFTTDKAPYMAEPMEVLTSRDYTSMIFAGPARTGKSDSLLNWVGWSADIDPADMMVIHMTQSTARDWTQGDLKKFFRANSAIDKLLAPGRQNRNTHDHTFLSGMRLLIKWPSITELSGKTIPRLWLADYDRMPPDIDKEGAPFDLAKKRSQTFGRNGMTVAESSPGFEITDPKWKPRPEAPHEAPPVGGGVLPLYNQGDRRRWYWCCPQCSERFEPSFSLMTWPDSKDKLEASQQAAMACPDCGFPITGDMRYELNLGGVWVPEGMWADAEGNLHGEKRGSMTASFWLKGPAAGFVTFEELVFKYLAAEETYKDTLAEEALKTVTTVDLGEAYLPKAMQSDRLPEALKSRSEDWGTTQEDPTVPEGVRFLTATIDVQAGSRSSFVVQVHGHGVGNEMWVVDMFKIRKSERIDDDGDHYMLDPASYLEDWNLLIPQVIEKTYPLADGSGRRMRIKAIGCDSGGADGVTSKAYDFWRSLRDDEEGRGHHLRFHLIKGTGQATAPRFRLAYPDSGQTGKKAIARGDVPVCFLQSNLWKDDASGMLGREDPGPGYLHFPHWAPDWFYKQLTTEIRTTKGWDNPVNKRNEAWDLLYYALGLMKHQSIALERIKWDKPPTWAEEWASNSLISEPGEAPKFSNPRKKLSLKELGARLA